MKAMQNKKQLSLPYNNNLYYVNIEDQMDAEMPNIVKDMPERT